MEKKKKNHNKLIITIAVILGLSIWAWDQLIVDHIIPKRFGVVEQGAICRSGRMSHRLIKGVLEENNIKVIITLEGLKDNERNQQAEIKAAKELGIEMHRFPLRGNGTGDVENYISAVATLRQARLDNKPVLVHCAVGTQRTGGVIATYHALFDNWTPQQIFAEMTKYDFIPRKNEELIPYLNNNIEQIANALKKKGLLKEVPDPLPVFIDSK